MKQEFFEHVLRLLIRKIQEHGSYNAFEALRDYIGENVIEDLADATEEEIESYIYNAFEPFEKFIKEIAEPGFIYDENMDCTMRRSRIKIDQTKAKNKAKTELDTSILSQKFSTLTSPEALILEEMSLRLEMNEEYIQSFQGFGTLYMYYSEKAQNKQKSLGMLKKKAICAKLSERADSYKYYILLGDNLSGSFKHKEAAKAYEESFLELIKQTNETVTNIESKVLNVLRMSRGQYSAAGDNKNASRLFVLENEEERKRTKSKGKLFYKCVSNYGESPGLVIFWCLVVIFSWSGMYYVSDIKMPSKTTYICNFLPDSSTSSVCNEQRPIEKSKEHPLTYVYFSAVTFTTLGYGDYSPLEGTSRLLASLQALLGIILTSLFIVTFVRKYSR